MLIVPLLDHTSAELSEHLRFVILLSTQRVLCTKAAAKQALAAFCWRSLCDCPAVLHSCKPLSDSFEHDTETAIAC
jgi:hypothetical protein